ncbi:MAG: glycosyltransferase family 2 protein, partial [Bacteroidetes bacterium]|nr:glycosyltransferase family 2 protein [Bacteroidota bacterium]
MSAPKVITAILNWNGKGWLEKFLPSVVATTYSNHVVCVIDNASTDDSIPFLKEHYQQVQIVQLDDNYGFTGGYNRGLAELEADYFAILNSDVEVEPDWISHLVERMQANPEIGAVQPKILQYKQKDEFEYAGACGGFIDRFGFPFCRGRIFFSNEKDHGQYNDARPVFWATGAAMFIKADLFKEFNGFDEDFFAHMEEIDLCWRMQNMGHQVWVEPKAVVYHVGGGTLGADNPRKTYLNFRNNLMMMAKNLPLGNAFVRIFFRMVLDGQAAIKELLGGNAGFFWAIGKAHFHFYLRLPQIAKKRKQIPHKVKLRTLP